MSLFRVGVLIASVTLLMGCSRSNNVLLGRVEAVVGEHLVVVTDCYRTSVTPPKQLPDSDGKHVYQFTPCRDANVLIRGDELIVNERSYGPLKQGASVLVDHGSVSIN